MNKVHYSICLQKKLADVNLSTLLEKTNNMQTFHFVLIFGVSLLFSCNKTTDTNEAPPSPEPAPAAITPDETFSAALPDSAVAEITFDTSAFNYREGYLEVDWKMLSNVTFEERYFEEVDNYLLFPYFSPLVKSLDGRAVSVTGYSIPIDETGVGDLVVLSAFPYTNCFFCGKAGPESVMEIRLQEPGKRLYMDEQATFRGTLRLNDSDVMALNYILEDAERVQ